MSPIQGFGMWVVLKGSAYHYPELCHPYRVGDETLKLWITGTLVLGERDDILNGNLVVELTLVLGMLEAEACPDIVTWVELASSCIAKEGADKAVLILAANLLKDDYAFAEDAAILLVDLERLLLGHYFE